MQRFYFLFLVSGLLFITSSASAMDSAEHPQPQTTFEAPIIRHIAVILPLESSSFGEAATMVKEGFAAATLREKQLPYVIRFYSTSDDPLDIFATHQQALAAGAAFVVGPLTRDGVSAIASTEHLDVPTLALNTSDGVAALSSKLYLFGLRMETEASQIARLAYASGKNHAFIITDDSGLSKRLQTAFSEQWHSEIGKTAEAIRYSEDPAKLQQLRTITADPDHLIFLALDAAKSRVIRPYLDPDAPVFATSQIFTDAENFLLNNDLNGIEFVDMPWLLQPDHPAVMAYGHPSASKSADMKRLYALGIDAFRLMTHLLPPMSQPIEEIPFDGVTGHIRFVPPNHFVREPVAARFEQGKVQLIRSQQEFAPYERQ
ncbi:penicillin-binding protein activator [Nitrosomonas sp. JL21]|uniref:penicillin-binding protein activator n=1 Tax=Nitrosomonas sp. JL21 TaxID=153949 RepID=UPI001368C65F|nr:penicillin-binding protein activator [Nitrosomonas sp. JL21]MBL8496245.1 penicillin-binding protein activator [Nitrosomonas sp.]MXS76987.1 penicillin-binding protein activator [Nitrosomonas sp. JL21]